MTLSVSTFQDAFDIQPLLRAISLEALLRVLTFFRRVGPVTDKRSLPAWSPARFRAGTSRKAEHVEELSCLVLDHDDGCALDVAREPWRSWLHVVHSTWSHTEGAPRFRLVLPLARPVPALRWASCWAWATEYAGRRNDRSCVDASRLYFLPCLRDDGDAHFAAIHPGPLLDLDATAPPPPPPQPRREWSSVPGRPFFDPAERDLLAHSLGAILRGEGSTRRAEGLVCPACGRASIWFWIEPGRLRAACCHHLNSCGWRGPLSELAGGQS